ncbi:PREDICTED: tomoregulin-2 [Gekko japonicus]|uniref:Tomoregulin-2 n=1 Tax=Gekko japonicus TaxID=146911 RepID=A0ABM1KGL9_GEKJA|nr:PREDICTED: tomoregulin-2 [Gekko japonicus]
MYPLVTRKWGGLTPILPPPSPEPGYRLLAALHPDDGCTTHSSVGEPPLATPDPAAAIADYTCVCNIDCSQTNFNPLCASDGKSYDNACQIKEASCQKQEKIEVMSLGRCQDNATTTTKTEDGHYARTDYAENANKLEESARGIYTPCPEHFSGFCRHGKCEHSANMLEPSCRCDAGYTGQHCEKKDYSVLYVVPGPVRFQYVLIAAVIGTIQIAIICVVVLCITRKCPRSNRIHRQKQNTGHYSSDNTTRASTRLI